MPSRAYSRPAKVLPAEIPVDIDLIVWDKQVLKPQDLSRPYLIQGLEDLGEALLPE